MSQDPSTSPVSSDDPQDDAPSSGTRAPSVFHDAAIAFRDTLGVALPTAAVLAVIEGVDGLVSNSQFIIPVSSQLLLLLTLFSFYAIACAGLSVPQALGAFVLRRWLQRPGHRDEPVLVPRLGGVFTRAPRLASTVLLGAAVFLVATFYLGYRLYRFTIDAQFELPHEAAAAMSWFHVAGVGLAGVVAAGLGYGGARLILRLLSSDRAFRLAAAIPVLTVAVLGYVLYTRIFARIVDLSWLSWGSFLLVYGAIQVLLLLVVHGHKPVKHDRGRWGRWAQHRAARWAQRAVVVVVVGAGLHAFSSRQLVRFQLYRFARFAPQVTTTVLSLLDRDGDGHPAVLGGLDCDDGDPRRHPDAHDVPSDGRDSNCVAGDPKRADIVAAWRAQRTVGKVRQAAHLPVARRHFNVLLITIDALRPDHMSVFGYHRYTTPNLEVLARSSLVFTQAHSQGNFTDLSLYSLLTGLYPSAFIKGQSLVPGRSLAQYLKAVGYETHAINDLREGRDFFARGFERFDSSLGAKNRGARQNQTAVSNDRDMTMLAKAVLSRPRTRPLFLWVHYSGPHGRYLQHKGYRFGNDERSRYDSEIANTDHQIAELLTHARKLGLLKNTVIVVGSDHGEAFGEHGFRTHGHSLYEEEIRVPLMIFVPTGRGGGHRRKVDVPVENVDIVPTVLDLLGYERPVSPLHGESLLDLAFAGTPLRSPEVFSEHRHQGGNGKTLRLGRWKLIYDLRYGFFELYDLKRDPKELRNLADARPGKLSAMKKRLYRFMDLWLNGFKTWPVGK